MTDQVRCQVCGTVFASGAEMALHRPTDPAATAPLAPAERPAEQAAWPEGMHQCRAPEALGLVHGPGGAWTQPEIAAVIPEN